MPELDFPTTRSANHHRVQDANIFVRDEGQGPPVLLLHGNPDSSDLWHAVIAGLRDDYRCLAPDLPGFGRSDIPPGFDFSLASMAAFIDDLLSQLNIQQPLRLVVHDFGGPYGLAWAIDQANRDQANRVQTNRVSHIAVINSLFSQRLRWHFWARIWRTPGLGEISMLLMNRWLFAWEIRRGSGGRLNREHIDQAYTRVDRRAKRMVLKLYRATDPECFVSWEGRLPALAQNTHIRVLWGRQDPYLSLGLAHTFATDDVHFFDRTGHWPPVEAPAEVTRQLLSLFRLPPAAG